MQENVISLEIEELQKGILAEAILPIKQEILVRSLEEKGFETGHLLTVNIHALLCSNELIHYSSDKLMAGKDNPHQLLLPDFEFSIGV